MHAHQHTLDPTDTDRQKDSPMHRCNHTHTHKQVESHPPTHRCTHTQACSSPASRTSLAPPGCVIMRLTEDFRMLKAVKRLTLQNNPNAQTSGQTEVWCGKHGRMFSKGALPRMEATAMWLLPWGSLPGGYCHEGYCQGDTALGANCRGTTPRGPGADVTGSNSTGSRPKVTHRRRRLWCMTLQDDMDPGMHSLCTRVPKH